MRLCGASSKAIFVAIIMLALMGRVFSLPVAMNIWTDKDVYDVGDVIKVHYSFENKSDQPIIMFAGSVCFYNYLFDSATGDPLRLVSSPASSNAFTPSDYLILLLRGERFENVLQVKFQKTGKGKMCLFMGIDGFWVPSEGVILEGCYSKNSELNEDMLKTWGLPIYDGLDLKSRIRFRVRDDQIKVDADSQKEKVECKGTKCSGKAIKASYLLTTFHEGRELNYDEVQELFQGVMMEKHKKGSESQRKSTGNF